MKAFKVEVGVELPTPEYGPNNNRTKGSWLATLEKSNEHPGQWCRSRINSPQHAAILRKKYPEYEIAHREVNAVGWLYFRHIEGLHT